MSVPPKRTPPNIEKLARRSSSRRMIFRKFLSQRTVMPYSATPPKPAITRLPRSSWSSEKVRIGWKGTRLPLGVDAGDRRRQRLDLQPSIATTVWPWFSR